MTAGPLAALRATVLEIRHDRADPARFLLPRQAAAVVRDDPDSLRWQQVDHV
jgi:hypothetical protein